MRHISYSQRLEGRLTSVGPGLVDVELAATRETPLGREALLASQLAFATERTFREVGTITFGAGGALRFTTLGHGDLAASPDGSLRHGTAVLAVEGMGELRGARGRITSNFLVRENGVLVDEQVVVLFLEDNDEGGEE